jgi:hypothetical protein
LAGPSRFTTSPDRIRTCNPRFRRPFRRTFVSYRIDTSRGALNRKRFSEILLVESEDLFRIPNSWNILACQMLQKLHFRLTKNLFGGVNRIAPLAPVCMYTEEESVLFSRHGLMGGETCDTETQRLRERQTPFWLRQQRREKQRTACLTAWQLPTVDGVALRHVKAVPGHRTPNYVASGALGRPLRLCPSLGLWALSKLQSSSEPLRLCVEVVALRVSAYQSVSRTRCNGLSLGPATRMRLYQTPPAGGLVWQEARVYN